jgi:hypothetical protein
MKKDADAERGWPPVKLVSLCVCVCVCVCVAWRTVQSGYLIPFFRCGIIRVPVLFFTLNNSLQTDRQTHAHFFAPTHTSFNVATSYKIPLFLALSWMRLGHTECWGTTVVRIALCVCVCVSARREVVDSGCLVSLALVGGCDGPDHSGRSFARWITC